MNKDQKLLAEAYGQIATGSSSDFESNIKQRAGENIYVLGVTPEGKKYGVNEEYDRYDDGDRWITEVNYRLEVQGEEPKYVSDSKGRELIRKAYQEHPGLNKHINPEMFKV